VKSHQSSVFSEEVREEKMAKSKKTRKLSTAQIVFYILSAILVLSMILSAATNF
jgi:hypothetical protein